MRLKNGSSGITTTGLIVLHMILEENDSSHATIPCHNLLISSLPTLEGEKGRFRCIWTAESTMTERSFGSAVSGLVILDTMPETNKH